jgi:hypothetical protein
VTYEELIEQFPKEATCAFCGERNEHWDEDGFFYLWTDPKKTTPADGRAACEKCCAGEPGKQHESLHGKDNEGRQK